VKTRQQMLKRYIVDCIVISERLKTVERPYLILLAVYNEWRRHSSALSAVRLQHNLSMTQR